MDTMRSPSLRIFVVEACCLLLLVGCGPKTVDTSSFVMLETSVGKLRKPMKPADRAQFDEALTYLVGEAALLSENEAPAHPDLVLVLYKPLSGMTSEAIIAEARRKRTEEVQSAVTQLESLQEGAEEQHALLAGFDLQKSRVYKRNKGFLEWPMIEFKARNNTGHDVWLIHFRAALLRPGHDEPWLVEEFDQLVLRGLAPGERDLWRIEPEKQEWVTLIDPHPEVEFFLEVLRLEGLGGNVIAATEYGEIEKIRYRLYSETLVKIRTGTTLALDSPPRPAERG
jgi:hypothetical protein